MQRPYTISVIIPVYNDSAYLAEALQSVFTQSYPPAEVIVVDDGSTDDSATIAMCFADQIQLHRLQHSGAGAARNYGVTKANGELLSFLDADDLWAPRKLERQVQALVENPDLEAVFAHLEHFYSPEISQEERNRLFCPSIPVKCTTAVAMLIRRKNFEKVGGFDQSGKLGEVVEWYLRARQNGLVDLVLDDVLVKRRIHRSNTGILRSSERSHYVTIVKNALDQRRSAQSTNNVSNTPDPSD
jgi:glycosyltransferase involved in cell wall biosynthesis